MVRKSKISQARRLSFDHDPGRFEIPPDDCWTGPAGAGECQPEFEDHREHKKRSAARAGWTRAIFWAGCSVSLAVAGLWALTSV